MHSNLCTKIYSRQIANVEFGGERERVGMSFNIEDRPDYMLEAFLDEQHILIKPLLVRRFTQLAQLDVKFQVLEKQLKKANPKEAILIQQELLSLSEEKVIVTKQIQDLAYKQMESLLEVENALESTKDKSVVGGVGSGGTTSVSSKRGNSGNIYEEIWCICRQTDDGRPMVACDNENKCPYFWWHVDCVDNYIQTRGIGTLPDEGTMHWFCPFCEANKKFKKQ
jgi:hypothetical protein